LRRAVEVANQLSRTTSAILSLNVAAALLMVAGGSAYEATELAKMRSSSSDKTGTGLDVLELRSFKVHDIAVGSFKPHSGEEVPADIVTKVGSRFWPVWPLLVFQIGILWVFFFLESISVRLGVQNPM